MLKKIVCISIAIFMLVLWPSQMVYAGLKVKKEFEGVWKSESSEIISINYANNMLEVFGTDKASIFHYSCTYKAQYANCLGKGVNHTISPPAQFLIETRLTLEIDKNQIIDEWTVTFSNLKKIQGKSVLKKVIKSDTR